MEKIVVRAAKTGGKKFEAVFTDGKSVRFGAAGASDYTKHKDPARMAKYVHRHGGRKTNAVAPKAIHADMLRVTRSAKENWSASGVKTAGFWSRWLLWSHPSLRSAVRQVNSILKGKYRVVLK